MKPAIWDSLTFSELIGDRLRNSESTRLTKQADDIRREIFSKENEDPVEAAAHALLRGDISSNLSPEYLASLVAGRITATRRAIELQNQALASLKGELSTAICKALRPDYDAIVKETSLCLANLRVLVEREQEFRENMINHDLAFSGIIPPLVVGNDVPEDALRQIDLYLAEGKKLGYL